ncbi:MAG: flagellar filament capping protein FliD [Proteobacteria bacterium]|nr:flagellar filament capping protein FliD [Pseudomonadota bacterium]
MADSTTISSTTTSPTSNTTSTTSNTKSATSTGKGFSGVGVISGIDWETLVEKTIDAKKTAMEAPYTRSKTDYQNKLTAWQSFNTSLSAMTTLINDKDKFNSDDGYKLFYSSLYCTNSEVKTADVMNVTVGTAAGPGTYSVEVSALAKAEKINSDVFTSKNTALGVAGDLVVNNKAVSILATDTLAGVMTKINSVGSGVTAAIIGVSDTEYRLTLQSDAEGAAGMSLKNGDVSTVLEQLTLHTGTEQLAHASGSDVLSDTYRDSTNEADTPDKTISTLLGLNNPQSGTVTIKGKTYTINLSTATLNSITAAINADAPSGTVASVVSVTDNDYVTTYKLKLTNVGLSDLTDQNNVLETLGILEGTRKNTITVGQDASLKVDGFAITSHSNAVTSAIEGVTLNLAGTTATATPIQVKILADNDTLIDKLTTYIGGISDILTAIKNQNTYSATDSKALLGDVNLSVIKDNITNALFAETSSNTLYKNLSSAGITFASDGTISMDTDALKKALLNNRTDVVNLLKNFGTSLNDKMNVYVDPYTGTLKDITESIQNEITSLDDRLAEMDQQFERQADLMRNRYNALESLISKSNSLKTFLSDTSDARKQTW